MKVTKIRAGLYTVIVGRSASRPWGTIFTVENRQSPADYGSEWLWYIEAENAPLYFDPCYTKREALQHISQWSFAAGSAA